MIGRRPRSFTVLELLAVTVLMVMSVKIATLGMYGLSDRAHLRTAASQLGAAYRLAIAEATQTNRPHVLEIDATGWKIRKPIFRERQWEWITTPRNKLAAGVRVKAIRATGAGESRPERDSLWRINAQPGRNNAGFDAELSLGSGAMVVAEIGGASGAIRIEREQYESP